MKTVSDKAKFIASLKGLRCEGCDGITYHAEPLPCPYDEDRPCNCCDVCRRECRNAESDLW